MSIDPISLDDVSEASVVARKQVLRDIINAEYPSLSLEEGTVNQQVILQPNAEIDVLQQLTIDRYRRSSSIAAIAADPTLADDALVDNVMSNFQVERRAGTKATGAITLVVTVGATYAIPVTMSITVGTRVFHSLENYTLITNATLTLPYTILLRERADGKWWATIPVEESVIGGELLAKDTAFTLTPDPGNTESVTATNDFVPGIPAETNAELVARMEEGTAMKSVGDRVAIAAVLKAEFSSVLDVSIIGLGDAESVRDARQLLGVSMGGRGDVYTRTATVPQRVRVTVLGVYTGVRELRSEFGVSGYFRDYRISFNADSVAAFYRVSDLTYMNPSNSSSATEFDYSFAEGATVAGWNEISRGLRAVDEPVSPRIRDAQEAVYSRYQGTVTLDIEYDLPTVNYQSAFEDLVEGYAETATLPVVMGAGEVQTLTVAEIRVLIADDTRRIYDVYVDVMPDVNDVQAFLTTRGNRPPGTDYLVKAPFPCFVGVSLTVAYPAAATAPVVQTVQDAVAAAVNALVLGTGSLSILTITAAAQAVLPAAAAMVLPVELVGVTRLPDGTSVTQASTSVLTLLDRPTMGVSVRTTAFLLRPEDVTVTLITM